MALGTARRSPLDLAVIGKCRTAALLDTNATAEVVRIAIEMSFPERRARHQALMAVIEKHDIAAWCQSFLAALARVAAAGDPTRWKKPESIRNALEKLRLSASQPRKSTAGRKVASTAPHP